MMDAPRFISEIVLIPAANGAFADGAFQRQHLRGALIEALLPKLIPLMDGTRTVDDLQHAFPDVPPEHVAMTVASLTEWGLAEAGCGASGAASGTREFFSRYGPATRVNKNGWEALELLEQCHFEVLSLAPGCSKYDDELASLLLASGAKHVTRMDKESLAATRETSAPMLMIAVAWCKSGESEMPDVDRWCRANRVNWLRASFNGATGCADLGPYFNITDGSACYECFADVHGTSMAPATAEANFAERFWLGMVATEAIYLVNQVAQPLTARGLRRYNTLDWTYKDLRVPHRGNCRTCSKDLNGGELNAAILFEDYVGLVSKAFPNPRAEQEQLRIGAAVSQNFKNLPNCPVRALSCSDLAVDENTLAVLNGKHGRCSREFIGLEELGTLLRRTAGLRAAPAAGKISRWCATAGNLGSVELFVAARQVADLSSGYYFYDAHDHALARFQRHSGSLDVSEFMRRVGIDSSGARPDALVVLTGAYHKLTKKYGVFGYRLTNLDAGVATSQLHLLARGLGLGSFTVPRWADDLIADQLHLRPIAEQSTAVVALYGKLKNRGQLYCKKAASSRQPEIVKQDKFRELSTPGVFEILYHESRTTEVDLQSAPSVVVPEPESNDRGGSIKLPSVRSTASGTVEEILARRSSVRDYRDQAITDVQLSTMLDAGVRGDVEDWPSEQLVPLKLFVFCTRVTSIGPGLYRYVPEGKSLEFVHKAVSRNEMEEMLLQTEYASAPVLILIAGNLTAACRRHGSFGHRQMLLRAGAAGHRMWMAALALGLEGSVFAGLVPGIARQRFSFNGTTRASLFAFTAGYRSAALNSSDGQVA